MKINETAVPVKAGATYVVAASNSAGKDGADYVCDGVDDQVQIQAAIDALTVSGGKIALLAGTYNTTSISVPDNVTFEGQGINTKLYLKNGATGPVITNAAHVAGNSGIIIKDLFVDGNDASAVSYSRGIELSNTAKSTILNCWVQNCKEGSTYSTRGVGIYIVDESADVTVKNCFATDNGHEGIGVRQLCERVSVIGCVSWDNDVEAVQVAVNTVPGACKDILVMGNLCNGHPDYSGIIAHGSGLERISIINNIINGSGAGIMILSDTLYSINNIISGNLIFNTKTHNAGISLYRTQNTIVNGNQIIDAAEKGIDLDTADNCTISNNRVNNSSGYGIAATDSDYCLFSSNTVKDSLAGFYTNGAYGIIDGNYFNSNAEHGALISGICNNVVNNYIIDNNTGDDITHMGLSVFNTHNLIKNNKIYLTNAAVGHQDGIYLAAAADDSVIEGNDLRQSGKNKLINNDGSTGTIIRDNTGYLTKYSGASTGTGAQQTIAHGLSITPTKVILWNIENGANPYQSAAANGTNIYVTAVVNQDYGWEAELI